MSARGVASIGSMYTAFAYAAFRPRFFACAAVRFTAQRRLIASARRWRPSGVIRTLRCAGFCGLAAAGAPVAAFFAAQRFFSASDSRLRLAGVMPPLRFTTSVKVGAGVVSAVPSISRSAASARSIAVFCRSSCAMMPFSWSAILSLILPVCAGCWGNHIVRAGNST